MLNKVLGKKRCSCGRLIIVKRTKDGTLRIPIPVCATCKTYGLEESKRLFVQEDAMLRKKSERTQFNISAGEKHINQWKNKK